MPDSSNRFVSQPFGITLLVAFGYIGGFFNIVGGLFVILDRNDANLQTESFHTANQLVTLGVVLMAIGLLQMALAAALGRGSGVVRVIFAIIAVFNLIGGLWGTVALHGEQRVTGIAAAVISGLVLYLLFNRRSEEFFEAAAYKA